MVKKLVLSLILLIVLLSSCKKHDDIETIIDSIEASSFVLNYMNYSASIMARAEARRMIKFDSLGNVDSAIVFKSTWSGIEVITNYGFDLQSVKKLRECLNQLNIRSFEIKISIVLYKSF